MRVLAPRLARSRVHRVYFDTADSAATPPDSRAPRAGEWRGPRGPVTRGQARDWPRRATPRPVIGCVLPPARLLLISSVISLFLSVSPLGSSRELSNRALPVYFLVIGFTCALLAGQSRAFILLLFSNCCAFFLKQPSLRALRWARARRSVYLRSG